MALKLRILVDTANGMRYKVHLILIAILWACFLTGCYRKQEGLLPLIEGDKPIYVCGGDDSGRYYKSIWKYTVDKSGKVYLWDSITPDHIDIYDEKGLFLR